MNATRVASDLMLRKPKTLAGDASVAEARAVLANPKVQLVLLADGERFVGAVTEIPAEAADDEQAVSYAEADPDTISPDTPGDVAFERAYANPHRRVVVLGEDESLLGLLCLDKTRTKFCQTSA
jgi:CBS domain-containing protein